MTATMLATASAPEPDDDEVPAALATPPAPPPVRRRNRPPQPIPGAPAEPAGADTGTDENPTTSRLMHVLELSLAGHSQDAIARRYGKTSRTIRNWLKTAKERRLKVLTNQSAETLAAEHHGLLSRQYADLLRMKHRAELRDDDMLLLKIQAQISNNLTARGIFLDRMGILDRLHFNNAPSDPREAREADAVFDVQAMSKLILAGDVEGMDRHIASVGNEPPEPDEDVF